MHPIIEKLKDQSIIIDSACSDSVFVSFSEDRFAQMIIKECASFLRDSLDNHFAAEQLESYFDID